MKTLDEQIKKQSQIWQAAWIKELTHGTPKTTGEVLELFEKVLDKLCPPAFKTGVKQCQTPDPILEGIYQPYPDPPEPEPGTDRAERLARRRLLEAADEANGYTEKAALPDDPCYCADYTVASSLRFEKVARARLEAWLKQPPKYRASLAQFVYWILPLWADAQTLTDMDQRWHSVFRVNSDNAEVDIDVPECMWHTIFKHVGLMTESADSLIRWGKRPTAEPEPALHPVFYDHLAGRTESTQTDRALFYMTALRCFGYAARLIATQSDLIRGDFSKFSVEIWVDGAWRVHHLDRTDEEMNALAEETWLTPLLGPDDFRATFPEVMDELTGEVFTEPRGRRWGVLKQAATHPLYNLDPYSPFSVPHVTGSGPNASVSFHTLHIPHVYLKEYYGRLLHYDAPSIVAETLAQHPQIRAFLIALGDKGHHFLRVMDQAPSGVALHSWLSYLLNWPAEQLATCLPERIYSLLPAPETLPKTRELTPLEANAERGLRISAEPFTPLNWPLLPKEIPGLDKHLPAFKADPQALTDWLLKNISRESESDENPVAPTGWPFPAVTTWRMAHLTQPAKLPALGWDALWVACSRAAGRPARLNPWTLQAEYYSETHQAFCPVFSHADVTPSLELSVEPNEDERVQEGDVAKFIREKAEAEQTASGLYEPDPYPLSPREQPLHLVTPSQPQPGVLWYQPSAEHKALPLRFIPEGDRTYHLTAGTYTFEPEQKSRSSHENRLQFNFDEKTNTLYWPSLG